jgi:phospholipase/carboxylesterase
MSIHKIENTIYAGKPLKEAQRVIIMIHGRGSSASKILSLSDSLDVSNFALVAPNATDGTWYPHSFLAPEVQNEPYLSSALENLKTVVNQVKNAGFESKNIYFTGFSQGACLTSEFIGRNVERFGGAFIFTGGVIGEKVELERYKGDFSGTPIFIGSGNPDFHVPVERVHATADIFRNLGAVVVCKIYAGIAHTIVPDEFREANLILGTIN